MCCLVIYSVVVKAATSRVHDTSIERVVGLSQKNLIERVVAYAIIMSFYGVLIGVPMTWIIFEIINVFVLSTDNNHVDFRLAFTIKGVVYSIGLAVLVPQLASLKPIQELLQKNGIYVGLSQNLGGHSQGRSLTTLKISKSQGSYSKFNPKLIMYSIFSITIGLIIF